VGAALCGASSIHRDKIGIASSNRDLISDPQRVFPLAKFALKAQALGNLEARDHAPSICLPDFPAIFAPS
jgi:hypothetical protein